MFWALLAWVPFFDINDFVLVFVESCYYSFYMLNLYMVFTIQVLSPPEILPEITYSLILLHSALDEDN